MLIKKFAALLMCCLFAVSATAQETPVESASPAKTAVATSAKKAVETVKVMLTEDGALSGNAVSSGTDKVAANVNVTLSANGKLVDAVQTDEKGNFSFANVAPGAYQMLGSTDGFVGSASYDVVGYDSGSSCSACSLGMAPASSEVIYDNYSSAPVSSFAPSACGTCSSPCGSCGGGLGGGSFGGGRLGGRLGGGLLSNGRIGLIGLAGLAGLGGSDDSSPDR